jgi:hypothetical protein
VAAGSSFVAASTHAADSRETIETIEKRFLLMRGGGVLRDVVLKIGILLEQLHLCSAQCTAKS